MIRTVIEVQCETSWDHESELKATLDKLGFEPKRSNEEVVYMRDMWAALDDAGINPHEITKAYRAKTGVVITQ